MSTFPFFPVINHTRDISVETPPSPGGIGGHLLVATEHRFQQTPDGVFWSASGHYETWRRLLPPPSGCSPFAHVTIAARVCQVRELSENAKPVEGPGLTVAPLPSYIGPLGYLRSSRRLRKAFSELVSSGTFTCFMARQPGLISGRLVQVLRSAGLSWITEVVGDPDEVFSLRGGIKHPLCRLFRWIISDLQRRVTAESLGVVYVSGGALQSRYPTRGIIGTASNVDLQPVCYRSPRPARSGRPRTGMQGQEDVFQLGSVP